MVIVKSDNTTILLKMLGTTGFTSSIILSLDSISSQRNSLHSGHSLNDRDPDERSGRFHPQIGSEWLFFRFSTTSRRVSWKSIFKAPILRDRSLLIRKSYMEQKEFSHPVPQWEVIGQFSGWARPKTNFAATPSPEHLCPRGLCNIDH